MNAAHSVATSRVRSRVTISVTSRDRRKRLQVRKPSVRRDRRKRLQVRKPPVRRDRQGVRSVVWGGGHALPANEYDRHPWGRHSCRLVFQTSRDQRKRLQVRKRCRGRLIADCSGDSFTAQDRLLTHGSESSLLNPDRKGGIPPPIANDGAVSARIRCSPDDRPFVNRKSSAIQTTVRFGC